MSEAMPLKTFLRAEDLLGMEFPGSGKSELWYGELIEMSPTSGGHGSLIVRLVLAFGNYLEAHPEFEPASEGVGFLLRRDPDLVLCPDFAIYRPEGTDPAKFVAAVPSSRSRCCPTAIPFRKSSGRHGRSSTPEPSNSGSSTVIRKEGDLVEYRAGILHGEGALAGLEIDLDRLFSRGRR